ncbi:hypothetical protein PARHAE_03957 [Paracoccus haematequi]|uniref:SEC-C motif protein n=1 Tax=Paracoccus haematequi TaxID=2491866 RepID=A0A3S4GTM5_9RHOB|nr:hypothetical protein [Paracoccus haematequi]VDS10738.1 hypothetical protein PARHAE_03957 [Paracoccus haematequi]
MAKQKKVPVPISAIESRFVSQLGFLQRSMEAYDAGAHDEVLRMAVALRTLLHKSRTSHPLVEQVHLQDTPLLSRCRLAAGNLISEFPLAMMMMGDDETVYVPLLNDFPFAPSRYLKASEWQDERVIVLREMGQEQSLTRWDLVLALANQDGGAHSDPDGVPENYFALVHEHFGGFIATIGTGPEENIIGMEKATMRHIAWEAHTSLSQAWKVELGKRGCQCNSGRQFRYCCGKRTA